MVLLISAIVLAALVGAGVIWTTAREEAERKRWGRRPGR